MANPPLWSDFTTRSPWYDIYNHGKLLVQCKINCSYADGHVETHYIANQNPNNWSAYFYVWGSTVCTITDDINRLGADSPAH